MPLSFKEFTQAMQFTPKGSTPEEAAQLVQDQTSKPSAVQEVMGAVERPLVGSKDSYFLQHQHAENEGPIRRTAEDLGASLTSPLNLGLTATGIGAGMAGKAGLMGISRGARLAEAALQAPLVAEGVHSMATGDTLGEKLGGAVEAGLGGHGMVSAASRALPSAARVLGATVAEEAAPVARTAIEEVSPSAGASTSPTTASNLAPALDSPPPQATPVARLQHRSSVGGLVELDPQKYGSGQAGAELRRKQTYPGEFSDRTYFTRAGGQVEPRFQKAPHLYQASIPEDRLYDLGKDPEGFLTQAGKLADGDGAPARSPWRRPSPRMRGMRATTTPSQRTR